ncbi:MAG TPA: family 43 glycosylhydrolase [Armatimonadota bacterium]|nr:family 43 glycosylhydrolase [Armatimonadota bacterium]
MLQHPNQQIGDAWFFVDNSTVHCYYLTCPLDVPRHTRWDIGHAVSNDLTNWTIVDPALVRGESGFFDHDGLATGSVIPFAGRYWMAYTTHHQATVGLAVSDDLYTWQKVSKTPITDVDPRYYEPMSHGVRKAKHWRDPFLFVHDGMVYHFVCASRNDGPEDRRGTVGVARTADMQHWQILPPPAIDAIDQEMECPQLYQQNGRYYLLFSSAAEWFTPEATTSIPGIFGWSSYAMVANSPFGPFTLQYGRIIPADYPVQPYACQIVQWQGNSYLLGTIQPPEYGVICDPIPVIFTEDGIHLKS